MDTSSINHLLANVPTEVFYHCCNPYNIEKFNKNAALEHGEIGRMFIDVILNTTNFGMTCKANYENFNQDYVWKNLAFAILPGMCFENKNWIDVVKLECRTLLNWTKNKPNIKERLVNFPPEFFSFVNENPRILGSLMGVFMKLAIKSKYFNDFTLSFWSKILNLFFMPSDSVSKNGPSICFSDECIVISHGWDDVSIYSHDLEFLDEFYFDDMNVNQLEFINNYLYIVGGGISTAEELIIVDFNNFDFKDFNNFKCPNVRVSLFAHDSDQPLSSPLCIGDTHIVGIQKDVNSPETLQLYVASIDKIIDCTTNEFEFTFIDEYMIHCQYDILLQKNEDGFILIGHNSDNNQLLSITLKFSEDGENLYVEDNQKLIPWPENTGSGVYADEIQYLNGRFFINYASNDKSPDELVDAMFITKRPDKGNSNAFDNIKLFDNKISNDRNYPIQLITPYKLAHISIPESSSPESTRLCITIIDYENGR